MKKLLLMIAMALAMAMPVMAAESDVADTVFANVSTTDSATVYTSSTKVSKYKNKQVQFIGRRGSGTFTNLSGTVGIQVSQDNSNWTALSVVDVTDGTASTITRTINSSVFWEDASAYVRFYFTKTKGAVKIMFRQQGNN